MASITHPSTSNYHHLPSLPRLKMNPLSNTNYSRSLAAIALANHSAALNQLSAPPPNCSSASACSSTTDFSGPAVAAPVGSGDARLSALLMRDGNDVSVTSSPLGSPNAAAWPQFGTVGGGIGGGGGAASLGGHLHHYFSPDLGSRPAATVLGFQGTSIETALKKLGECSRTSTTTADGCRDFNGMSHQQQQHSLSSVRSSAEATNIGTRFGGISAMASSQHHPHQQQLNLHQLQMRENPAPAATATLRNDWATSIPCSSDPNLSFASSMASLGLQDPMRGGGGGGGASLSARAILLGGMCNNSRGQQQVDSYMLPGNVHGEVINEGSLSARMMRSMGDGGGSHQQQQQQGGDVSCLDLGDDAILQEMIGSYNAGNAVASSVMNAHLHSLPSSPSSSHHPHHHHHHHHFPMQQQVGIEASLNSATDWASLLLDAGSPGHASNDQGGLRPKPVGMGAAPRGPHFTSESGFAERTAKMLFHAAGEGQQQQIQGDILGPASGSLHHHLTATTFMDGAGGINFGGSPGALEAAAAAVSSRSPLQSPGFGATLLTSNSTRTRLEVDGSKSSSPGRLAGTATTADNLSEPSRMWRPPSSSEAAAAGKQPVVGGLMRTLSANSRGSVEMGVVVERHNSAREMLDSLCERKDALELELEQCSSMSAMLDDLPPPPTAAAAAADKRGGFPKSERKLSRTSSPSVSTMMDLASMEPGTSSACNSVSEPTDDKKVDAPAREDPSGPGTGKGKALLSDIAEAGGENSSSGKEECKENSGTESQGKKRKDRAAEEKLPAKTSATSSRTIPVKDTKQEDAEVPNRSKRSRGSTSEPDSVRAKFGDTRSKSGSDNSGDSAKPPEAPKPDYIHVRARRGQATDSHSLAERVRREKISERMKYLQDLVPGCSKVTGKAMMLDEIINYVQSLQRQVEFLSMKLQSVNPRMDFSMESLLSTEHSRGFPQGGQQQLMIGSEAITIPSAAYPQLHPQQQAIAMQQLAVTCGLDMRSLGTQLDTVAGSLRRSLVSPASGSSITMAHSARDPFDESVSQVSTVWDGELHSVVQMGYAQNRLSSLASPGLRGSLPPGNMKMER